MLPTMQINMSKPDRILRIAAAVAFVILFYTGTIPGTLGLIGLVVATIFLGTAIFGNCPLYTLLGVSTCPRKS